MLTVQFLGLNAIDSKGEQGEGEKRLLVPCTHLKQLNTSLGYSLIIQEGPHTTAKAGYTAEATGR